MSLGRSKAISWGRRLLVASLVACALVAARPVAEAQRSGARIIKRFKAPPPAGRIATQQAGTLDRNNYVGIKGAALALMRKFPPDRFYIVGVGRSPSRIIAFLKSLSIDGEPQSGDVSPLASQIPASGMKSAVSADRYAEFDRHFDRFLPEDVKQGKRTIVLIDSIGTGSSVKNTGAQLQRYFQARGIQSQVVLSGFAQRAPAGFDTLTNSFGGALGQDAADYGKHQIGIAGGRLEDLEGKKMDAHSAFRKSLVTFMEEDGELDEIIDREFKQLLDRIEPEPEPAPKAEPAPAPARRARPGVTRAQAWGVRNPFNARLAAAGLSTAGYKETYKDDEFSVLAGTQYPELRDASLELLKRYSPDTNHRYIGVGRSSSAVVGFLENLGVAPGYLPIDGVKKDADKLAELQSQFDEVFAGFLSRDTARSGKTIVLFQGSETGESLPLVKQLLEDYLARAGSTSKVVMVAFAPDNARLPGIDQIRAPAGLGGLQDGIGKAIAKFDYYRVGKTEDAITPANERAEYRTFRTQLANLMKRDPALNQALSAADE